MYFTELKDRKLYFDGVSVFDPIKVDELSKIYDIKYVDYYTDEIKNYNRLVSDKIQLKTNSSELHLDLGWNFPIEYMELDLLDFIYNKHIELTSSMNIDEINNRDIRLIQEYQLFEQCNQLNLIRTSIYIVDTLEKNNLIWGVGRGSSVSSYLLYIIGLHDIDSFGYNLDISDFLKIG